RSLYHPDDDCQQIGHQQGSDIVGYKHTGHSFSCPTLYKNFLKHAASTCNQDDKPSRCQCPVRKFQQLLGIITFLKSEKIGSNNCGNGQCDKRMAQESKQVYPWVIC